MTSATDVLRSPIFRTRPGVGILAAAARVMRRFATWITAWPAEGALALRGALADYLTIGRARVNLQPRSRFSIVNGSCAGRRSILTARVLIDAGDRVALEEPNYRAADAVFRAAGGVIDSIEVDARMGCASTIPRRASPQITEWWLPVTPSHQFPTGALMPLGPAASNCSAWADRTEALIFEDDYDSEYRYSEPAHRVAAIAR